MASSSVLLFFFILAIATRGILAVDYTVNNTASNTPGGARFDRDIGAPYTLRIMNASSHFIWTTFRQTSPADRKGTQTVPLFIDDDMARAGWAAYTSSDRIHVSSDRIHVSASYIQGYSGDVRLEFTGVLFHQMAHVWQWFGTGQSVPGGLIEGIADYVRLKAGYAPSHWVSPGQGDRWDQGYDVTARFLDYCDSLRNGFVAELNGRMRNGYSDNYFVDLLGGKTVDQLWMDYKATYGLPPVQGPSPLSGDFYPRGDGGSSTYPERWKLVVVVLGVTGAGLLIIVSIFCSIRRRRRRGSHHNNESNLNVEQFLLKHGSLALKRYKYSEIMKMTKSLSDKLGQGGYGSVYKGKLPDGSFVAVKVLTDTGSNNGEEFINEVASISRTSHVNIVNLLGFCFDSKHRALVYEYMSNNSLDKYIGGGSTGRSHNLDMEILYMISVGVAKGLEYLHTGCNTRIVHFDIKPQNILLDDEFCPKISDFGLAKLCKKKQSLLSVMGTRGTIGYIAPEVFSRNFGGISHKSDVYSYGMMALEMAGANTTVVEDQTHVTTHSSENYFPDKIYERVVDVTRRLDNLTMEEEEEIARKMILVGFWCIQTNPLERPPISKVVEMLEGSIESIKIPPKPVLFTPTLPMLGELSSSFSSYVDETQPSTEGIIQT